MLITDISSNLRGTSYGSMQAATTSSYLPHRGRAFGVRDLSTRGSQLTCSALVENCLNVSRDLAHKELSIVEQRSRHY